MENSTAPVQPAAPAAEQASNDGFAARWNPAPPTDAPVQAKQPKSFQQAFIDNSKTVAKDLGIGENVQEPQEPVPQHEPEPIDPQGDDELELSPGQKFKRKELAARLKAAEALEKSQEQFKRAAYTKMQQAAEQRKAAEAQIAQAQQAMAIQQRLAWVAQSNDPSLILKEFGIDQDQFIEQQLQRRYEDMQKTPEQRAIEELNHYKAQIAQQQQEAQRQQQEQQRQQQEQQNEQETNRAAQNYSRAFMQTADAMGLPKTALTIQRFANLLAGAQANGHDPTFEELGNAVRQQYRQDVESYLDSERGFNELSKEAQNKVRKQLLSQVSGNAPGTAAQAPGQSTPRARAAKPMSTREYNDYINKLTQGGV